MFLPLRSYLSLDALELWDATCKLKGSDMFQYLTLWCPATNKLDFYLNILFVRTFFFFLFSILILHVLSLFLFLWFAPLCYSTLCTTPEREISYFLSRQKGKMQMRSDGRYESRCLLAQLSIQNNGPTADYFPAREIKKNTVATKTLLLHWLFSRKKGRQKDRFVSAKYISSRSFGIYIGHGCVSRLNASESRKSKQLYNLCSTVCNSNSSSSRRRRI